MRSEPVDRFAPRTGARPIEAAVRLPTRGGELAGDLRVPGGARGVVVFAHGSGSGRRSPRNVAVAESLHEAGLGTLLFDLLTEAEEVEDSVTRRLRFDVALLAQRLSDALLWVERERSLRGLAVGLFGASTGAAAALLAAAALGDRVRSVVSRGGRPDLAGDALPRVRAATLLVVGSLDEDVLALNREAYERLGGVRRLEVVEGASHLFEERGALERVARLAADWFLRTLSPRPNPAGTP
jgi:pimeloyl-ACP methyl ester carboxylesterase